jgi:hypothetical protein
MYTLHKNINIKKSCMCKPFQRSFKKHILQKQLKHKSISTYVYAIILYNYMYL